MTLESVALWRCLHTSSASGFHRRLGRDTVAERERGDRQVTVMVRDLGSEV